MKPAIRIAAAAAAAGIASFTYQRIAEVRDRHRFPPPGRLVDIGGRRLHLVTVGEGSPAVVIIPALADNVLLWMRVLEGAATDTELACMTGPGSDGATRRLAGAGRLISWRPTCMHC